MPVVDIMNLISPNADGINDYWVIKDLNAMQPAKVVIYNRSGKPVYQSNDYNNDCQELTMESLARRNVLLYNRRVKR